MDKQTIMNRYIDMLASEDPLTRTFAEYQLAQIGAIESKAKTGDTARPIKPSKWAHVPLSELFKAQGNALHQGGGSTWECGHEPLHSSKSGRCLLINTATGYWWCRSCGGRGDAATYIMEVNGWNYMKAAEWLTAKYGPPAGGLRKKKRVLEA